MRNEICYHHIIFDFLKERISKFKLKQHTQIKDHKYLKK